MIGEKSLIIHRKKKGKLEISSKVDIENMEDLAIVYTPGVAEVSKLIAEDKKRAYEYTIKGNSVAIVTDGSAVLGLGNIGPEAALPVMEGKAILMKRFADVDGYPICLNTQKTKDIINLVKFIAPGFGGVNLEDISAPRCFEIESKLQDIGIPVFHDDQHGTAIVVLAALLNASKLVDKKISDLRIVINGAGAAGVATAKLLKCIEKDKTCIPVKEILICDRNGIIYKGRKKMRKYKEDLVKITNPSRKKGSLKDAVKGADVFIGVSSANLLSGSMVRSMNKDPIIFALANPIPEIMPEKAKRNGAAIVATGRSDFPNQVNNALVFPGLFRGALDVKASRITDSMMIKAAYALAGCVKPQREHILPSIFHKGVHEKVAEAVRKAKN